MSTAPFPESPGPNPRPKAEPPRSVPATGHPGVDAAIHAIMNATDLPPADQIAQFEAAHRALRDILATIDQA